MTAESRHSRNDDLLAQTKRLLNRLDLKARKRLGQHFLVDPEVLGVVVKNAELAPEDVVIEVGPGLGLLTGELAAKASRLVAVELDDRLAAVLQWRLASVGNVSVVHGDILKLQPAALLGEEKVKYKVVANLPYYITSAIIRRFLEASHKPRLMVLMVQREVAEAITAEPGRMSLLSTSVQFYGKPEIAGYAPAACFYPPPEVDSAVLKIDVYPQPAVAVDDIDGFFSLVRAGFTASRKQIANSLALGLGLPKNEVMLLLEGAGIISRRRAETLALEEWQRLWQVLRERQKC